MAGPLDPDGIESWDLTLHGEGFEALSSDPFSFAGEFLYQGLKRVRVDLLDRRVSSYRPCGTCNEARTEFHATIEWVPQRQTEFW